jgi:hypothetical protein
MRKIVTLFCVLMSGIALSQNPSWVLFDHTNAPFTNDSITCVKVDTNNVKWVGTRNGLFMFNNNTWTEFNTSNSNIPSNRIGKFEIAYDNTIWFTNNGNGFYKFQNNLFSLYNQSNLPALSTQNFTGLTIDSNDVFLWTANEGIVRYNAVTNAVYNINTINSCLKAIKKLVVHGNHMIYGVATNTLPPGSGPPQTLADSIDHVNDFVISNTPTLSISYCFSDFYSECTYFDVDADQYGHRFEVGRYFTGNMSTNQRLRTYDADNVLLSDIQYNQQPEYQFSKNGHGYYRLVMMNTNVYALNVTLYNPPSSNTYGPWNSIIPLGIIENFAIDTLNNIWLATPGGLVGYNDLGVVTALHEKNTDDIIIYPNPAQNNLTFKFSKQSSSTVYILLRNVLGKQVAEYTSQVTNSMAGIDLADLSNGLYYYTLVNNEKMIKGKITILK